MITFNLFDGEQPHPSAHYRNRPQTMSEALVEVVRIFSSNFHYMAWVEDVQKTSTGLTVKVGSYGMGGEKWIHVYEGPQEEIAPLADVCLWFYGATGQASEDFKLKASKQPFAKTI